MLHLSHILLKITMILGVKFVVCICFSKKKKSAHCKCCPNLVEIISNYH